MELSEALTHFIRIQLFVIFPFVAVSPFIRNEPTLYPFHNEYNFYVLILIIPFRLSILPSVPCIVAPLHQKQKRDEFEAKIPFHHIHAIERIWHFLCHMRVCVCVHGVMNSSVPSDYYY